MNLSEIIQGALEDLNRDVDQQNREEYEGRLLRYINAGYYKLLEVVHPYETQSVTLDENGRFGLEQLGFDEKGNKIGSARKLADESMGIFANGGTPGSTVDITYEIIPAELASQSDEPEYLPESFHAGLVYFAVYRELSTGGTARQSRSMVFYEMYHDVYRRLFSLYANIKYANPKPGFSFGKVRK